MIEKTGNFLTVEAAANESGFTPYYIRKLARAGTIQAVKWGAAWMIDAPSLLAYKKQMDDLGTQKHKPKSVQE